MKAIKSLTKYKCSFNFVNNGKNFFLIINSTTLFLLLKVLLIIKKLKLKKQTKC